MLPTFASGGLLVAGCDEAGRGPLAGPVVAAAVVLPPGFGHELLNDSKALNERDRLAARDVIREHALHFATGQLDHAEIDRHNILKASFMAMHRALDQLPETPGLVIVDGNRFLHWNFVPYQCIVKGDARYAEIAAASILAKTLRDDLMRELHREYPQYGWDRNKGYPTREHREAVVRYGLSPYHRRTFCGRLVEGC